MPIWSVKIESRYWALQKYTGRLVLREAAEWFLFEVLFPSWEYSLLKLKVLAIDCSQRQFDTSFLHRRSCIHISIWHMTLIIDRFFFLGPSQLSSSSKTTSSLNALISMINLFCHHIYIDSSRSNYQQNKTFECISRT